MTLRIASWPRLTGTNPYQRLFYDAIAPQGMIHAGDLEYTDSWLRTNRHRVDAIHFHWPEGLWRPPARGVHASFRALLAFRCYLAAARRLRIRVIWTLHNLQPHEEYSAFDRLGYSMLARRADLVICHSRWAANTAISRWNPRDCVVMPHGNYRDVYPRPAARESVLSKLALDPTVPTFCCVGILRHYKGVDLAVDAIGKLKGAAQLIIAGQPNPGFEMSEIRWAVAANPRLRLVDRELDNQEFADIVGACDSVLLPYRRITGSGALLAAWSIGTCAIASDLPYFREVREPEPAGCQLFARDNADSLARVIREQRVEQREHRRRAARKLATHYSWEACVRPVTERLRGWVPARPISAAGRAGVRDERELGGRD